MLAQKKPALEQAIGALKYVSRDEQMRADAEAREWFLMDQRVAARANAINEVRIAKLLEEAEIEKTKQAQLIAEIEKVNARIEEEKQQQAAQFAEQLAKVEKERQEEAERFALLYERIAELERLQSIK